MRVYESFTDLSGGFSFTGLHRAANPSGSGTLTVNGSGFVSSATVQWNGSPLATTFVSATQLTAQVEQSRRAIERAELGLVRYRTGIISCGDWDSVRAPLITRMQGEALGVQVPGVGSEPQAASQ